MKFHELIVSKIQTILKHLIAASTYIEILVEKRMLDPGMQNGILHFEEIYYTNYRQLRQS